MNIRSTHPNDLEKANQVIADAIMTWELPDRVKRLTLPSYKYNEHDLQNMTIVVAEQDNTIVGVAAWYTADISDAPEKKSALLLHGIYVDPQHHRRGIGHALFLAAETTVREQGLDGLLVKAQKDSNDFYVRQGMTKLSVSDRQRDLEHRYWKDVVLPS